MVREQLYARGIDDRRVLRGMMRVPRHHFLHRDAGPEAYADHSFPIGYQQTMSQPWMVAFLCQALKLAGNESVLEIGTGSGYQCAVLSMLAGRIITVERIQALAERARTALADGAFANVEVHVADGALGWPTGAPYNRILMTAAAERLPESLLSQLTDGGIFVGPVVDASGGQRVVRIVRHADRFEMDRLAACVFVPLLRDVILDDTVSESPQTRSRVGSTHAG